MPFIACIQHDTDKILNVFSISAAEGVLMARVLKPPAPLALTDGELSVFLAGSIEMGRAEAWQAVVESSLADLPIAILNPRRDEWDASWEQSFHNPLFREQVEWELEGLERASVVAMYFAPATQAPITPLELGLLARSPPPRSSVSHAALERQKKGIKNNSFPNLAFLRVVAI